MTVMSLMMIVLSTIMMTVTAVVDIDNNHNYDTYDGYSKNNLMIMKAVIKAMITIK